MRRRSYLATTGALLASPLVGVGRGSTVTQAETFEPLGDVEIAGTHDTVPGPDGETAYVATADGFATVDVSDPAEPTVLANPRELLADRENGPLEEIYDVKVDGDRLAVAGPANDVSEFTGFVLYDVSDPENPKQEAFHETEYPIHNLDFDDGVAYLTGNNQQDNPLVAVDCSDDDPREVGRWSLLDHDSAWEDVEPYLRVLHDVYVQDGRAYLAHWDAGTWVLDVSDPSAISAVSQVRGRSIDELSSLDTPSTEYVETPGNDHYVAVDESADLLAVGAESWDVGATDHVGGPGDIELYDISTETEPEQLATIDAPSTADPAQDGIWTTSHNFDLRDERLYASWYRGGISVHNLSDPDEPEEMVFWEDRDGTSFFTAMAADDCVIASSIADPAGADTAEGLFTFPVPTDETETVVTRPTTTADTSTSTTEPTTSPTTTQASSPDTTETTESDSGSGSGPGFGVLSALTGLTAAGWYALRTRRSDAE